MQVAAAKSTYIVWGLGFGDDEDEWVLCSTHATLAQASIALAKVREGSDLPTSYTKITEEVLQD